jgi:hypothetical protein
VLRDVGNGLCLGEWVVGEITQGCGWWAQGRGNSCAQGVT